ncbi:MAG TPA: beta-L-arabinofuranosidase domain-containing protein [Phycisphaerae bacterium]|nr:beta-L-arabinofuranosidase domain-containing protein [Phycisphaerae bacterium]
MRTPLSVLAIAATIALGTAAIAQEPATTLPQPQAIPFNLDQVRLLDSPFKHAQEMDLQLLLSLDADRFLHTFRLNAGLPSSAKPYGGWERPDCELRGHSLGHYLSACSLMYAATGDEKLKQRVDYLVAELAKCQDALAEHGSNKGYLSAFPESLFDRNDKSENVWAPWYTMHKIMAGLLDAAVYCHNAQALAVDVNLAEWVKFRVDRLPTDQFQKSLNNEHGGMNEVMANLSAASGNADFLRIAQAFNHQRVFLPLAIGEDRLDGLHANTQIPKIIGAAREYELTGNPEYRHIAEFFWQEVALKRSYVFGGHSDNEHFFPIADFAKHLSPATAETCNTYNMLKLTRLLFEWTPSDVSMNFYERALYNDILASQNPDTAMMTYFMSLQPDHFKTYSTRENSFWCCFGTGMENHAKYGDTIYFHSPDNSSLFLNLFIPSELNWQSKHMNITQETRFPEEENTRLTFHTTTPQQLTLRFRQPDWINGQLSADVNGQHADFEKNADSQLLAITRQWHEGDVLTLHLPMRLHTEMLPYSNSLVAIMYGPLVLAGDLGRADVPTQEARDQWDLFKVKDPLSPTLSTSKEDLLTHIHPVAGKSMTFTTDGIGQPHDFPLIPFYSITNQRYTVYWKLEQKAAAK